MRAVNQIGSTLRNVGHPVAYYPELARFFGSQKAALLFCQLFYWKDKGELKDGWIYKKIDDLVYEIGLTKYEIFSARKCLCEKGVLEEKRKKVPPLVHFKINEEVLSQLWTNYVVKHGIAGRKLKNKSINQNDYVAKYNISETTQEITHKNTSETKRPRGNAIFSCEGESGGGPESIGEIISKTR